MNANEKELTPEQEDLINDCHEKQLRKDEEKEEEDKKYKRIPINPKRFEKILIKIGRAKNV